MSKSNKHDAGQRFVDIISRSTKVLTPLLAKYIYLPDRDTREKIKQAIRNLIDELVVYLQYLDSKK